MSIDFCFTQGTTCGIGADPVTLNVTRTDQAELAAPEPIIAVVFTVGGPVVYERKNEQFA